MKSIDSCINILKYPSVTIFTSKNNNNYLDVYILDHDDIDATCDDGGW